MTLEALRQKPVGVLETRTFTFKYKESEYDEEYSLVKVKDGRYFIGFSDDGSYCSERVSEKEMVQLLNDKESSDRWAWEIYIQSPHLSCWMD